jgi:transcriptional adapter 3
MRQSEGRTSFKMPLPLTQKGVGKKGRDRQSRSRNTTPSLVQPPPNDGEHTAFLDLPMDSFRTADDLIEIYGSTIPSSQDLEALLERLNKLTDVVDTRCNVADRGMRMLADKRKKRIAETENDRVEAENKERAKRDAADEEERGRHRASKIKKRKDISTAREERPLTHGAHGLAAQDGSNLGTATLHGVAIPTTNKFPRSFA